MKNKFIIILLLIAGVNTLLFSQYKLSNYVFGSGAVQSSNQQYSVTGTLGQPVIGKSNSGQFSARFGFWYYVPSGNTLPTVETHELSVIRGKTAVGSGTVVTDGGLNVTERGLVWSVNPNPSLNVNEIGHSVCGSGLGYFQSDITGLNDLTTYYVKSYATNSLGTAYGEEISFTTTDETPPIVICKNITVFLDNDGLASIIADDIDGGCFDESGIKSIEVDRSVFDCSNLGSNNVILVVTDNYDNRAFCQGTVAVIDDIHPTISVSVSPSNLWPANNTMISITANVSVSDNCPEASYKLKSITSNEDITGDVEGASYGATDLSFNLRAQRDGNGDGRYYLITYTSSDLSGNNTDASVSVFVPHDMGRETEKTLDEAVAGEFEAKLGGVHPNPFSETTEIEYYISASAKVKLYITDITGRVVAVLLDGESSSGWNTISYNTARLANGVYFLRLESNGINSAMQMHKME